jgi:hypothetical protein
MPSPTLPAAAWLLAIVGSLAAPWAAGQSLRDARDYPPQRRVSPPPLRAAPIPAPAIAPATPTAPPRANAELPGREIPVGETLQQFITALVVDQIPREYENTKKWRGTKKVMSGLDWEVDGVKVETRRQWKVVNHGTWSMYRLKLIDPETECEVRLENLRDLGNNKAAFDLIGVARLDCFGRMSRWQRGVQLISLSAEADAKVRLHAHVEVTMGIDPRTFPPDILLHPVVTAADLQLQEFQLRRVSKAEGPLVKQIGEGVEEGVQEYLAEHRQKLVDKMNGQLEKKRNKMRIPLSKLTTSPWGSWFTDFFSKSPAKSNAPPPMPAAAAAQ